MVPAASGREERSGLAQFVPAARILLAEQCVVQAVFDSIVQDPQWWPGVIKRASRLCVAELARWVESRKLQLRSPQVSVLPAQGDHSFRCHLCPASFALRKHLGTHLLKRHGIWSPARHYAVSEHCVACMRWFHDVRRVQTHLKGSPKCLERSAHVLAPLTHQQILSLEAEVTNRQLALKRGQWSRFCSVLPTTVFFGPRLPSKSERLASFDESTSIAELSLGFNPCSADITWIQRHISEASIEGAREAACSFWTRDALHVRSFTLVSPA